MVCYVVMVDMLLWFVMLLVVITILDNSQEIWLLFYLFVKYRIVSFCNYNYIVTQYYELLLIPEPTNSANDKSEGFSLINPSMLPSHFCLPLRQKDHSFLPAFPSFFAQTNQALFLSVFLSIY